MGRGIKQPRGGVVDAGGLGYTHAYTTDETVILLLYSGLRIYDCVSGSGY